ncbi:MAG: cell division protein FtsQ/DivIB [Gammaproteobacteria bacterium]|nr:cell division protein FtsQ/DivIB [Gammaproteobacteria bacterium]MCW5582697.1 cell division protein FtsQ/DivIB [Gammaproteobacteria bacterium]
MMSLRKGKQPRNYVEYLSQTFKITLLGAMVLTVVFTLNQLNFSQCFPIRTVRVYGIYHVNHQEVQRLLTPLVSRGFFTINVEYIRDQLLQMPWISDLYVRRVWPDQVEITIVEKKPAAKWNGKSLLSEAGELFIPKQEINQQDLPQFTGPEGQQIFMLRYFHNMNRLLWPLHVKISYLELTPFFTWKLTLNNGITMQIGHKDILTRLSHFVKVYPKIVGTHPLGVDYIDLRYSNGMAVRWKKEAIATT